MFSKTIARTMRFTVKPAFSFTVECNKKTKILHWCKNRCLYIRWIVLFPLPFVCKNRCLYIRWIVLFPHPFVSDIGVRTDAVRASPTVNRSEIVVGDHIYTYRTGYSFTHHGIYVGNNQVVHFSPQRISDIIGTTSLESSAYSRPCDCGYRKPENVVVRTCLDCFLSGGSLYRYQYDSPALTTIVKRGGTSTTAKSDVPELVVRRAMYLLNNGFGDYHLYENNCEDFALYCKTGLRIRSKRSPGVSRQVTDLSGMIGPAWAGFITSAALGPIGTVVGAGLYGWNIYEFDLGVRKDVDRVDVEDLVPFRLPKAAKEPSKKA